ncbi:MAG TPA: DUF3047 domain-containing protein [Spirochaetota bacterium]|nr:DUF3047 domain-containing protein [Spirochaetota bacterium]HPS87428.1 DUF3047 domain-containing protein [Spirochaetota bacterium]
MRRKPALIIIFLFTIISSWIFRPETLLSGPDFIMLEDFQKYSGNPFSEWSSREDIKKAYPVYKIIEENGNKFLRASTVNANNSVQLGKSNIRWDLYSYPYISWDWRVRIIPKGGNEYPGNPNDSAAAIYVVFQTGRVPFAGWQYQPANWIKYVWSSTLPVGTVVSRKISKFGVNLYEGKYIVVASGKKDLGKWITFKRNVIADYEKNFGKKPAYKALVIGILTDSNSTKSQAEADYDNIKASSY